MTFGLWINFTDEIQLVLQKIQLFDVDKVMYPCTGKALPDMRVTYSSPPLTGVYATTTNSSVQNDQVKIEFSNGATTIINSGSTEYVNRLSTTQFKAEVCDAKANFNGSSSAFKTHFVRNY